jgi:hypothetical protein
MLILFSGKRRPVFRDPEITVLGAARRFALPGGAMTTAAGCRKACFAGDAEGQTFAGHGAHCCFFTTAREDN